MLPTVLQYEQKKIDKSSYGLIRFHETEEFMKQRSTKMFPLK